MPPSSVPVGPEYDYEVAQSLPVRRRRLRYQKLNLKFNWMASGKRYCHCTDIIMCEYLPPLVIESLAAAALLDERQE